MSSHEHTRSRRGEAPSHTITAEQAVALRSLAIEWRDEWRAEMAGRHATQRQNGFAKPKSVVSPRWATLERRDAAEFATAIARQEFGRFYWNGKLAAQLVQALERRPAAGRAGTSKPVRRKNIAR